MKDLYKILGVTESADDATIKSAYRKLAKENHPDVTGGDKRKTERFKEINEAYAILGDKQKRSEYDRLKHAPVAPDGMPEGFDPEAFARAFGGGGGRPGRGGVTFGGDFGGDIGDIFSSLFGDAAARRGGFGGAGRARARTSRGTDLVTTLEIPFAEAALGTRRTVRTGSGSTADVNIPPGVDTGARLRVPGQGGPAPGKGGSPGDLYLDVTVLPHRHLRRSGPDVELALPVSVSEAALGAKISVPTLEGPVTLTIPPGTSSGAKLRLRGRGVKNPDGSRGDQICRVEVAVPKGAPDQPELKRLFEELAKITADRPVRDF